MYDVPESFESVGIDAYRKTGTFSLLMQSWVAVTPE